MIFYLDSITAKSWKLPDSQIDVIKEEKYSVGLQESNQIPF